MGIARGLRISVQWVNKVMTRAHSYHVTALRLGAILHEEPGSSFHMTLMAGRGGRCAAQPDPSALCWVEVGCGAWADTVGKTHKPLQSASKWIAVCVAEPPVPHGTGSALPKKTTARDRDSKTERSSRARHRSVCATRGREEARCTSEGRLHTVQQRRSHSYSTGKLNQKFHRRLIPVSRRRPRDVHKGIRQ